MKRITITESQLPLIEYHSQQVFNADDEGNVYFRKKNYEHFVDYLEQIGRYGRLKPTSWTKDTVTQKIYDVLNHVEPNDDDLDYDDYLENINNLICDDPEDVPCIFAGDFLVAWDEFLDEGNEIDYENVRQFLWNYKFDFMYDDDLLTDYGRERVNEVVTNAFRDKIYNYDFMDDITVNDRGLIYAERDIAIPNFNSSEGDYYDILTKEFNDGIGVYFSWKKGGADVYEGHSRGPVSSTTITMECWVSPDDVNWENTVYKNCYILNSECELEIEFDSSLVEIERITLRDNYKDDNKVNGIDVTNASLISRPIIVPAFDARGVHKSELPSRINRQK